jgi:hypothetical protein
METSTLIQMFLGVIIAIGGFFIKHLFHVLHYHEQRINELEVLTSKQSADNNNLFKKLDAVEQKLDRLLEKLIK